MTVCYISENLPIPWSIFLLKKLIVAQVFVFLVVMPYGDVLG